MRLSPSTSDLNPSALWTGVIIALGGITYLSLFYFGVALELMLLVVVLTLAGLYVGSRPAYAVVFLVIFVSIFLNTANYTFFAYTADGARTGMSAESRLLVLMRLPLVFFAVVVVLARYGADYLGFLRRNWDACIFSVLPFASVVFAIDRVGALQYAVWFFLAIHTILAFLYLLGIHVPSRQWSEHAAWLLLSSYILTVILSVWGLRNYYGGVLTPSFADTNIHAKACAVVVAAILVLVLQQRSPMASRFLRKVPFILLLSIGAAAVLTLLLSAKRSPILGVGMTLVLYTFSGTFGGTGKIGANVLRSVLLVGALVFVAWQVLPQAEVTLQRFERTFDPSRDGSTQERLEIWRNAMTTIKANPAVGVGLDNGRQASEGLAATSGVAGYGLHNTYLAVLVEMGVLGAIFFLILLVRSFNLWRAKCSKSLKWAIVLLACSPLMLGMLEYNLTPGQFMFWPIWIVLLFPRIALVELYPTEKSRIRSVT